MGSIRSVNDAKPKGFVKDVLEDGIAEKINWLPMPVKPKCSHSQSTVVPSSVTETFIIIVEDHHYSKKFVIRMAIRRYSSSYVGVLSSQKRQSAQLIRPARKRIDSRPERSRSLDFTKTAKIFIYCKKLS